MIMLCAVSFNVRKVRSVHNFMKFALIFYFAEAVCFTHPNEIWVREIKTNIYFLAKTTKYTGTEMQGGGSLIYKSPKCIIA